MRRSLFSGCWDIRYYVAFRGDGLLFTVIVGGAVGVLTSLGLHLSRLNGYTPRASFSLFLGVGITALQYFWDFTGRVLFPGKQDASLSWYLLIAVLLSTVVLLRDAFRQRQLGQAMQAASF
jgi:uncharacterized membrane protein YdcZ (DUF606 family)